MVLVLLSRLGRTPTFVVPIINPPFADYSRQLALTQDLGERLINNK